MDEEITDNTEVGSSKQKASNRTLDKFHEIEIQEVFQAIVSIQALRIQVGIFFGTVNLAALGVAFSTQMAGIIFLANLLIIALVIVDNRGRIALFSLYKRAFQLEETYAPGDGSTFLTIFVGGFRVDDIKRITLTDSKQDQLLALHRRIIKVPGFVGFWLPIGVLIVQIAFGLIMWQVAGWSLF